MCWPPLVGGTIPVFMHTCNFVFMILTPWPQLEGRLVKSRPRGACAGWGWLAPCPLPGWSLTQAPPAAGWAQAVRFGVAGGGGKGLSFGVHIWEPLAHSCRLSACLRMDLDRTEWEGLGGWFAPADRQTEIQTGAGGAGDSRAQQAGRRLGKRCLELSGHLSPVPDLRADRPTDPACSTLSRLRTKLERDSRTPQF